MTPSQQKEITGETPEVRQKETKRRQTDRIIDTIDIIDNIDIIDIIDIEDIIHIIHIKYIS